MWSGCSHAQVALDHRQRIPAWMSQLALVCLRSWGLGRFVRPFSLALVKAGPDVGVEVLRSHRIVGCSARPQPELVNTHSPVRWSLARVSAATSIVRMLRWVLVAPGARGPSESTRAAGDPARQRWLR